MSAVRGRVPSFTYFHLLDDDDDDYRTCGLLFRFSFDILNPDAHTRREGRQRAAIQGNKRERKEKNRKRMAYNKERRLTWKHFYDFIWTCGVCVCVCFSFPSDAGLLLLLAHSWLWLLLMLTQHLEQQLSSPFSFIMLRCYGSTGLYFSPLGHTELENDLFFFLQNFSFVFREELETMSLYYYEFFCSSF